MEGALHVMAESQKSKKISGGKTEKGKKLQKTRKEKCAENRKMAFWSRGKAMETPYSPPPIIVH